MDAPVSMTMSILQLWMLQCHWQCQSCSYGCSNVTDNVNPAAMDAPMSVPMSILQLWMLQCHWHWGIHSYRVDLVFLLFGVMPTSHRILMINQLTLIICYSKSHIKQIAIAETKQNLQTKISTTVERNCLLTHWIIHQSSLIWEHNCTKNINIYNLPWITVFFDHVKVQFIIHMYFFAHFELLLTMSFHQKPKWVWFCHNGTNGVSVVRIFKTEVITRT